MVGQSRDGQREGDGIEGGGADGVGEWLTSAVATRVAADLRQFQRLVKIVARRAIVEPHAGVGQSQQFQRELIGNNESPSERGRSGVRDPAKI